MKKLATLLMFVFLSGCNLVPSIPNIGSFGSKKPESTRQEEKSSEVSVAASVAAQAAKDAMEKAAAAEQKAVEDRKQMEAEYAKLKIETHRAYEELKKKDQDNFDKIAELNYGIYFVTQEKKKVDINTTIAHLRSKEVMIRTDKLTDAEKTEIQKEVADEKQKTVDQLYIKYKATIDLAVNQKAQLDDAEALIVQKEKEKSQLREANRIAIEKIEAEKNAEVDRIRTEAADQVRLLKEAQKQQILQWSIYALGGFGIIFIVLGVLIRSITFLISGVTFIGLAYLAASIPPWALAASAGVSILCMIIAQIFFKSNKEQKK